MINNRRVRLKPIHYFALLVLVAVAVAWIHHRSASSAEKAVSTAKTPREKWVYIPVKNPQDPILKEIQGQKDFEELSQFVGRPGLEKWRDHQIALVEFQRFASDRPLEYRLPIALLHPCPPEQEGADGIFTGTIRMWKGNERLALDKQGEHAAEIGDLVTVELKDFDLWIFKQFDFGHLAEDLETAPLGARPVVKDAATGRRALALIKGVKEVNWLLRGPLKNPYKQAPTASEDPAKPRSGPRQLTAKAEVAWQKLLRLLDENFSLNQLRKKDETTKAITAQAELTPENLNALGQLFFPMKIWSQNLMETHYRQLTLAINGVILYGVTPQNSFSGAEQGYDDRPSLPLDSYHYLCFKLERKEVHPKKTQEENEAASKNESAWQQLVGKPAFSLPCNVTLRLPAAELQLPTQILSDAKDEACRFNLIGIQQWKFIVTVCVFCAILAFLGWLARTTNILRDSNGRVRPDGIEPVSLGKTQMAFWFILTACAYAFLWVTTQRTDTINETCLILLGIGSGTALGAALISESSGVKKYLVTSSLAESREDISDDIRDAIVVRLRKLALAVSSQDLETRKEMVALLRKLEHDGEQACSETQHYASSMRRLHQLRTTLQADWELPEEATETGTREEIADAISALARKLTLAFQAGSPEQGAPVEQRREAQLLADELALLGAQQAEFKNMADTPWKRLFNDWLSEGPTGKYSFHRFQMLAWTMLLGFIFVAKVLDDRTMPEFSPMTLALLGISAGTYLGFKIPGAGKEEPATPSATARG